MIDARTIQRLADAEAERQRSIPVLSQRDLHAAIAATQPAREDPDAETRAAIVAAVTAVAAEHNAAVARAGQIGIQAGLATGRTLARRGY